MAKIPRVEITDKALKVLKVEAALSGLPQKETLEALILRGASSRTLSLVEGTASMEEIEVKPQPTLMEVEEMEPLPEDTQCPHCGSHEVKEVTPEMEATPIVDIETKTHKKPQMEEGAAIASSKPRRKKITPETITAIKNMWTRSPRPTVTEISKELDYSRSTIGDCIKRMREKGELRD